MKICIMIMIVAMVLVGCAPGQGQVQIQVDPDSQEVIAKITARHVGFELQREYPDVVKEVLIISKKILLAKDDIIAESVKSLTSVLINKVTDDPLLIMNIKDLVSLIKINADVEITEEQIKIFHAVAKGLISGIETGNRLCREVEDINIKIGE